MAAESPSNAVSETVKMVELLRTYEGDGESVDKRIHGSTDGVFARTKEQTLLYCNRKGRRIVKFPRMFSPPSAEGPR